MKKWTSSVNWDKPKYILPKVWDKGRYFVFTQMDNKSMDYVWKDWKDMFITRTAHFFEHLYRGNFFVRKHFQAQLAIKSRTNLIY